MRTFMGVLLVVAASLLTSGSGIGSTSAIAPSSGKQLCTALSPADFANVGVAVTALGQANVDDPASAYCVYEGKARGVEFDIFYPAGDTPDAVKATERTTWGEVGGKFDPIPVRGADSAHITLATPGKLPSASISVRRGKAVFVISIPAGANARQQLLTLTQTVISRLKH